MIHVHPPTVDVIPQKMVSSADWRRTLVISTLLVLILCVAAIPTLTTLTGFFFVRQDLAVSFVMVAVFTFAGLKQDGFAGKQLTLSDPAIIMIAGTVALIVGSRIGHNAIMHGYSLSRDEQMAIHDATIFASGQLVAPVPEAWQKMVVLLNREFISGQYGTEFTGSGYRPVNALAHALMMKLNLVHFTAPIMSAIGMAATYFVAKRTWPTDRQIQSMSVLFYLCSVQIWAASMTTYAMSTLLALDMVWLALFLRRDVIGYGCALIVGFFAVGVHQVPYHPMFAVPFIALLLIERRWLVSAIYVVSYIAFVSFWLRYEQFALFMMGADAATAQLADIRNTFSSHFNLQRATGALSFTAANFLRFLSWQHLLLLPLLVIAGKAAWRDRNWLLIAMIIACLLPPMLKSVQIPYQGHGWGYRYCHGIIGLTCILAAVGWRELSHRSIANPRVFVTATLFTVGIALPWQLWNASNFSGAYATVNTQLEQLKTDFVVIDAAAAPFANDLVNNRADFSNRPLRLLAGQISPHFIPELCRRGVVTLFPTAQLGPINKYWGLETKTTIRYQSVIDNFRRQCPRRIN